MELDEADEMVFPRLLVNLLVLNTNTLGLPNGN